MCQRALIEKTTNKKIEPIEESYRRPPEPMENKDDETERTTTDETNIQSY